MSHLFSTIPFGLITFYSVFQNVFASPTFLQSPFKPEIENLYSNGPIYKEFSGPLQNPKPKSANSIKINFNGSYASFNQSSLPSKECFEKIVYETMKCVENKNTKIVKPIKTSNVINNIHNAAIKCKATRDQLIVFTAIALHNVYTFYKFPAANKNENINSINDNTSRGLLQITSKCYYTQLTKSSSNDYLKKPYLLNEFNSKTIFDEFLLFQREFYSRKDKCELVNKVYEKAVLRMTPDEAKLLSCCFICECIDIAKSKGVAELSNLLAKLERRQKILCCLMSNFRRFQNMM